MYWSARATFPGGKSAEMAPTEHTAIIASQPLSTKALIFALCYIMCGGLLALPWLWWRCKKINSFSISPLLSFKQVNGT